MNNAQDIETETEAHADDCSCRNCFEAHMEAYEAEAREHGAVFGMDGEVA